MPACFQVKLDYVDGTISVQWSQVAHLESNRLFLVQTESGAVYTGKLSTTGVSNDPPIKIEIAAAPKNEAPKNASQRGSGGSRSARSSRLSQTSETFWQSIQWRH